jgi:hypothetical protein
MNKTTIAGKLLIASMAVSIAFTSCKKDKKDDPVPTPPPATPGTPTPNFEGATSVWAAVITTTNIPLVGVKELSMGTGGYFVGTSTNAFRDAGAVKLDDNNLTKQSNNSYLWSNLNNNIWGTNNTQADWVIAGNGTVVPALTYTTSKGFPVVAEINSAATVNTANDYTVTLMSNIFNADSVMVILAAGSKTVSKTYYGANANNFIITSAEMAGMSGSGIIQVAAYNWEQNAAGTENIYFVNEKVVSKTITVQ